MTFEPLKFEIQEELAPKTRIRVLGVGGGGSNAVARMLHDGLAGVEFAVLNTDAQALAVSPAPTKLAIGTKITQGLGAGADPSVGRQAALEDTEKIIEMLEGADMVFVTAGMGGGTGTGAAPVVASLAKELGALTVAVVTKPFEFEGTKRRKQADQGLAELASVVDTVIAIPNDRILEQAPEDTSVAEGFALADDVLRQAVQGISDIITTPGLINRDFSDIKTIMTGMGYAMMGTATASGPKAAINAAEKAIGCALLEAGGVSGARGVLINITGASSLRLHEVNQACSLVRKACMNDDVEINFGVVVDETMGDEVKVTVIATGFQRENLPVIQRRNVYSFSQPAPAPVSMPAPAPAPVAPPAPVMQDELELDESQPEEDLFETEMATDEEPEMIEEEAPMTMAAAASVAPTPMPAPAPRAVQPEPEPQPALQPEDELEVPAILRRNRRFLH
ncbi:MAG: cell division protein FtsZ [Pseudomonadota bacterium]